MAKKLDKPTPPVDRWFNEDDPDGRQVHLGETRKQHSAYLRYRNMSGRRSLRRLAREMELSDGGPRYGEDQLFHLSKHYFWVSRVEYSVWLEEVEFHEKLRRRRMEATDTLYKHGQKALKRVEQMTNWPLAQVSTEEGHIILPAKWTQADASRLLAAGQRALLAGAGILSSKDLIREAPPPEVRPLGETLPPGVTEEDVDRVLEAVAAQIIKRLVPQEDDPNKPDLPKPPRLDAY